MRRKHIGQILAVIGLVLLLSSTLTFLIGAPALALGKVVLALALFGVYAITNFGALGGAASSRGTFFYATSAVATVAVVGLLVTANYLAAKNPKTFDLTGNKIHTLSPDTVKTVGELEQDVTVHAFFRPGDQVYEALEDLFRRYAALGEHFKYEFIDQHKDPVKVEQFGIRDGGPRVVVRHGKNETRPQELSEESLTNAIVKVTRSQTKTLYFVTGHGEADPDDTSPQGMSGVKERMENEGLRTRTLNLATASRIPPDAQALIIAGPAKPFLPAEVALVREYLESGGKAFVMVEPLVASGLDELLLAFNVEADDSLVIDPSSRQLGASEAIPVVQEYNEQSPIVRGFRLNTLFPTARPLTALRDESVAAVAQPLALAMPSAWGELNPENEVRRDENEKGGPFPLVVTSTLDTRAAGEGRRGDEARLVVAGDRDFATNQYRNLYGNEDFYLNCLSWLAEQTERITIRPRLREASRLYLTEAQKTSVFVLAIDVLPVILLATGLVVWVVRRSK